MCGVVAAVVTGVTYLSPTGSSPRSPVVTMSGATGGVERKYYLRDESTSIFGGSSSSAEPVAPIWPDALITGPNAFDQPTTTAEAPELGWTKVEDEPCNPQLGEPYRKNGGYGSTYGAGYGGYGSAYG